MKSINLQFCDLETVHYVKFLKSHLSDGNKIKLSSNEFGGFELPCSKSTSESHYIVLADVCPGTTTFNYHYISLVNSFDCVQSF